MKKIYHDLIAKFIKIYKQYKNFSTNLFLCISYKLLKTIYIVNIIKKYCKNFIQYFYFSCILYIILQKKKNKILQ